VVLTDAEVGPGWTIDAPYRETAEEIVAYREEGNLTVDMEASAIFTVGALLECAPLRSSACPTYFTAKNGNRTSNLEPLGHLWRLFETVESMLLSDDPTSLPSS